MLGDSNIIVKFVTDPFYKKWVVIFLFIALPVWFFQEPVTEFVKGKLNKESLVTENKTLKEALKIEGEALKFYQNEVVDLRIQLKEFEERYNESELKLNLLEERLESNSSNSSKRREFWANRRDSINKRNQFVIDSIESAYQIKEDSLLNTLRILNDTL